MELTKTRLHAGVWEGELSYQTSDLPEVLVATYGQEIGDCKVLQDPAKVDSWVVRFEIPPSLISDGIQTFTMTLKDTGEKIGSFSIVAGEGLAEDLREEMSLLREELDMLKSAFRRHCSDTGAK